MSKTETSDRQESHIGEKPSFDPELKQELESLGMQDTIGETVMCTVKDVTKTGDAIEITLDPPIGESFTKISDIPHSESDKCLLMDMLEDKGYSLIAAEEIIDEEVPFRYKGDSWRYKKRDTSVRRIITDKYHVLENNADVESRCGPDRLRDSLRLATMIIGFPLISVLAFLIFVSGENRKGMDTFVGFVSYGFGTFVWISVAYWISVLL